MQAIENHSQKSTKRSEGHNVKKVIDFRLDNGKRYYKVKWETSWELEDNLQEYQNVLNEFWSFVDRVKVDREEPPQRKKARLINTDDLQQRATNAPLHFSSQNNIATEITANDTTAHTDLQPANLENLAKITTQSSKEPVVRQTPENRVTIVKKEALPMAVVTQQQQQQLAHQSQQQAAAFNTSTESEEGGGEDDKEKLAATGNGSDVEETILLDKNDIALSWRNPYVRIVFFCRVCNSVQPFQHDEILWKEHFIKQHQMLAINEESSGKLQVKFGNITEAEYKDAPLIQKVEYLIRKWGINQYVRLAFLCRECGKEQPPRYTGNWRHHFMSHRRTKPVPCLQCTKRFKSTQELNRHMKVWHMIDQDIQRQIEFSCDKCNLSFRHQNDMLQHKNIHIYNSLQPVPMPEQPKLIAEEECNSAFASQQSSRCNSPMVSDPQAVHQKLICGECFMTFNTTIELNQHKIYYHRLTDFPDLCEDCLTCQNDAELEAHRSSVHQGSQSGKTTFKEVLPLRSPPHFSHEDTSRVHICKFCGKGFKRRYDLNRHTSKVHNMTFDAAKKVNGGVDGEQGIVLLSPNSQLQDIYQPTILHNLRPALPVVSETTKSSESAAVSSMHLQDEEDDFSCTMAHQPPTMCDEMFKGDSPSSIHYRDDQ